MKTLKKKKKDIVLEQAVENPILAGISHTFLCVLTSFLVGRKANLLLSKCYWWIWYNTLSLWAQLNVLFVKDVSYNS